MAKVLLIGSGGREHAIAVSLSSSKHVSHIYVSPGNAGTENSLRNSKLQNVDINVKDFNQVVNWCKKNAINLVVVGPEDPLANGIADSLTENGILCFGPSARAAKIEACKAFAKTFMDKYSIPTARWASFTDADEACNHIKSVEYPALVVKAAGLAAGKGVVVAKTKDEACAAAKQMLEERLFGCASETVVIEELLDGEEVSVLAFTDGKNFAAFPPAQDHKRLNDGDIGPNTGGMGAYCPCPQVSFSEIENIKSTVIQRTIDGFNSEGIKYVGILYAGIMLTKDGPKVLEYNCRFGDPETQVLLPMLKSDLYETMMSCVNGTIGLNSPQFFDDRFVVAVIVVSGGYPGSYKKGYEIKGINDAEEKHNCTVFHAGTATASDKILTCGGRVLAVVACDTSLTDAINNAQKGACTIDFTNSFHRKDIGHKALRYLSPSLTYKDSGVDISAGDSLIEAIKPLAKATSRVGCQVELGMFGGMFDLKAAGYVDPLLVSGTDGVGTKLKVAQLCKMHDTVGIDLVAMCVNDVLAHGAEPLFFLDYFACGKLDVSVAKYVVAGIAKGCNLAGCALIGGETAEMPGMYKDGDYDLAGFTVGAIERQLQLPRCEDIEAGDAVIGVASSGIHSNGFSLVRKIIEWSGYEYSMPCPFNEQETLGNAILTPTKIYSKSLLSVLRNGKVKAFAHITGGGLTENIPRVLPKNLCVRLNASNWEIPPVFGWLMSEGNVEESEMARTFNCGIGAVLIVSVKDAISVLDEIRNKSEKAWIIGAVENKVGDGAKVIIENLKHRLKQSYTRLPRQINGLSQKRNMKVGVLISGSGTNLQALIDYSLNPSNESAAKIVLVLSNVAGVKGLSRAQNAGIPTKVISHKNFSSRQLFDEAVDAALSDAGVELICLAGFMRILTGWFTRKWTGRLINIHPSLLPAFKGHQAHKLVLDSGVRISGCTAHFVTEEVDSGAILVQESVPVETGDTESTLSERVKTKEHIAFPKAMELVASGRATYDKDTNKVIWT